MSVAVFQKAQLAGMSVVARIDLPLPEYHFAAPVRIHRQEYRVIRLVRYCGWYRLGLWRQSQPNLQ